MSGALFTSVDTFLSSAKIDPTRELSNYGALEKETFLLLVRQFVRQFVRRFDFEA